MVTLAQAETDVFPGGDPQAAPVSTGLSAPWWARGGAPARWRGRLVQYRHSLICMFLLVVVDVRDTTGPTKISPESEIAGLPNETDN